MSSLPQPRPTLDSNVVAPRGARRLLPRAPLMARLLAARRQRWVVLQGPAGCGKTSMLLGWRRELLALNIDVAWVSVTADDTLPRFADRLLASLGDAVTPWSRATVGVVLEADSDDLAIEHWVIALVQSLEASTRELTVMLDDVHLLCEPRLFQLLQWLLDYAPENVHLVCATRTVLPLQHAASRLQAQGQLSVFDLQDLRFGSEESEHFLREQLGDISTRDAQALHALTDGWAAGLQRLAADLKSQRDDSAITLRVSKANGFVRYFDAEIVQHLPVEDAKLLTVAAICGRFCASLAATLLGARQQTAAVERQLVRLEGERLFISQVKGPDRETWYRLHPLLREVLLRRFAQQSAGEQLQRHALARGWFHEHGQADEAVHHAVQAGDVQAAADIIETCAYELLANGDLSQLSGLLRQLTAEQLRERFGLLIVLANLQLFARHFEQLDLVLHHLHSRLDMLAPNTRHALTVLQAGKAMHQDQGEALAKLETQLLAIPPQVDDFVYSGRCNSLAWLHLYRGEYAQARQLVEQGDRVAGSPRRSLMGRCIGGMSLLLEGRISQAEPVFRDVLHEAEHRGRGFAMVTCMAASLLANVLYERNDGEGVCELLEPRLKGLERLSVPETVLKALWALANAHRLAGRHHEAVAQLQRLENYATRHGLTRLRAHALFNRLRWQLQVGEAEQAQASWQQLQAAVAQQPQPDAETLMVLQGAQVEMALHQRRHGVAIALLPALIERASRQGRGRSVAQLHLLAAVAAHGAGNLDGYQQHMLQALRLGHRLSLLRSLLDVAPQVQELFLALHAQNSLDPVLSFYLQRLLHAAQPSSAAAPTAQPAALSQLREREREVLELLAQAMTNKKIARVLGVSPETVKWHLKNIFPKLGVSGREEAIAKMRELSATAQVHRG